MAKITPLKKNPIEHYEYNFAFENWNGHSTETITNTFHVLKLLIEDDTLLRGANYGSKPQFRKQVNAFELRTDLLIIRLIGSNLTIRFISGFSEWEASAPCTLLTLSHFVELFGSIQAIIFQVNYRFNTPIELDRSRDRVSTIPESTIRLDTSKYINQKIDAVAEYQSIFSKSSSISFIEKWRNKLLNFSIDTTITTAFAQTPIFTDYIIKTAVSTFDVSTETTDFNDTILRFHGLSKDLFFKNITEELIEVLNA